MGFLIFFTCVVVLFLSISRIVPIILSWLFERKYKIPITIGKIALPYLKLCDIQISKNEYTIQIEEVGIKSSFLNSELTKLITLVVKDVRINKSLSRNNLPHPSVAQQKKNNLDFRQKKVPHFINTFAQFMAVHVYNISVIVQLDTECLLQILPKDLHLDGSILKNAKSLLATLNITDAYVSVLKRADNEARTKLAEFSFGITLETVLVAQGPLSVEKLDVKMTHSRASIRSGFYSLLQSSKSCNLSELQKMKEEIKEIHIKEAPPKTNKPWWYYQKGKTIIFESKSFSELHAQNELDDQAEGKNEDVLGKILPIVPKNCTLHVDDTSFKGYSENGKIEYTSTLQSMALNYRSVSQTERNGVLFNFYLNHFSLENNTDKTIELKTFSIDAKLKNNVVNIYLQQNNLLITYNHAIIFKWIWSNFLAKLWHQPKIKQTVPKATTVYFDSKKRYSMLEEIMKNISINFCAEISNVVVVIRFIGGNSSSIGFNKLRLMLDQVQESRGTIYDSYLANLLLGDRHWQTELLIESLWWSFKEWNHGTDISKVMHVWGTPVYLGMGLIKLCTSEDKGLKLYSLLDTVQLEWSLQLADYTILALKSFLQYRFKLKEFLNKKPAEVKDGLLLTTSVVIYHFNCFLQSQNDEYFVSRLDTINVDRCNGISSFKFEEFKIFTLTDTGDYYTCIRTEDILNYKVFVKNSHLELSKKDSGAVEYNISLWDHNTVFWSTNFHLKALLLVKDIQEFGTNFMSVLPKIKRPEIHPRDLPVKMINCRNYGKFELHIDLNKNHFLKVVTDDFLLSTHSHWNPKNRNVNHLINSVSVAMDGADLFEVKGITVMKILKDHPESAKVKTERKEAQYYFTEFNNQTFLLEVCLLKVVFPHEHSFAEAIQEQLISVIKWLKIMHKKEDPLAYRDIPADWLIKVKDFLLEMSDDPFEVRLRDNFELLEDEYNESIKRQKMLKEKITQLLKTHLHMPAGKVEELYATLKKRNADIYIQRSKLMYQAVPQRTRLFAWSMTNVELMILMEYTQLAPEFRIQQMDKDSPWPEEDMEFSTVWCRNISLRCVEWKFQLRDFPQPLLKIRGMYLCGQIAGAEQLAPKRVLEPGDMLDAPCVRGTIVLLAEHKETNIVTGMLGSGSACVTKVTYYGNGVIYCITALNQKNEETGGTSNITDGGVGNRYVEIELESFRGHGLEFYVSIYARNNTNASSNARIPAMVQSLIGHN